MKKTAKSVLSLLLAVVMIVGLLPVTAAAEETNNTTMVGTWHTDVSMSSAELGVDAPDSVLRCELAFAADGTVTADWTAVELSGLRMFFHQMFVSSYYALAYGMGITDLAEVEEFCQESTGMSVSAYMDTIVTAEAIANAFTPASTEGTYRVSNDATKLYLDMTLMNQVSDPNVANPLSIVHGDTMSFNTVSFGQEDYVMNCILVTNIDFTNFAADEIYQIAGQSNNITFTVDVNEDWEFVNLYQGDDYVGAMYDNGRNGDAVANDGTYSFVHTTNITEPCTQTYNVAFGLDSSDEVSIHYFPEMTDEYAAQAEAEAASVEAEIEGISSTYEDENGLIASDEVATVLAAVGNYVDGLYDNGEIFEYEVNDNNVLVKMNSGITFVYIPEVEGLDSIGSNVSMTVLTCQPCYSGYGNYRENYIPYPDGITVPLSMPDAAANAVASTFSNYSFSANRNYDDGEVSLERIKTFSANQVIIWHGHGGYSSTYHSFLVTGDSYNYRAHHADNVQGRVLRSTHNDAMITGKYITKYCGNMDNTLVYLAACDSGKDNYLAASFLNKGAEAVVANSDTILTLYNLTMEHTTIRNMTRVNPETANYYTLGEALTAAKNTYGSSDAIYGGRGATPKIFGGTDAQNYRFGDVSTGTLAGKVCSAVNRTTPIPEATITLARGNASISFQPESDGSYIREVPAGEYAINISAPGYIDFEGTINVVQDDVNYMETFLMVNDVPGPGYAAGTIINAFDGSGIEGATLVVRRGWYNTTGSIVTTLTSDYDGNYDLEVADVGNYTISVSKDGYMSNSFNVVAMDEVHYMQDCTLTPIIAEGTYRIVLTWGVDPQDVDSHMVGRLTNGSQFHVYYGHRSQYDGDLEVCNLDTDDVTSYGPETITLVPNSSEPYYYYLYHYYGSGSLSTSGANIKVYLGSNKIAEFNVPTDQGTSRYWNVFAIVNGELVVRNTITSRPDVSYINSPSSQSGVTYTDIELIHDAPKDYAPADEDNVEETVPATEAPVVEETVPSTEAPVVEETTPATEAPVVEETAPATEAPVVEETAPATEAPVVEETAPAAE